MCHENEEWCKIWRGIDWSVQNLHDEFYKFWPEHSKISKHLHFNDLLFHGLHLQWSWVWWHCRLMQNLKETSLVLSNLTWRIWKLFVHRLKKSNFFLESKMVELNQYKNSKQSDREDPVWKPYFTLEINE